MTIHIIHMTTLYPCDRFEVDGRISFKIGHKLPGGMCTLHLILITLLHDIYLPGPEPPQQAMQSLTLPCWDLQCWLQEVEPGPGLYKNAFLFYQAVCDHLPFTRVGQYILVQKIC